MSIAVIGHITKDTVEVSERKDEKIGGTAFYAGITLANLGIKTKIFTKLAGKDRVLLKNLQHKNIGLFPSYSRYTTSFRNVYPKGTDYREQFIESVAEPFSVKEVRGIGDCELVHLGPLTKGDIQLSLVKYLKSCGLLISLDVQGYLRGIRNKKVVLTDWKGKEKFLKYVDIVKADEKEANILTGKNDKSAAKALAAIGPSEIVITDGFRGSFVYSRQQNKYFRIPAFRPSVIKDVTGCGDTYIAAYLAKRIESDDISECGRFAAMCGTMKIEDGFFNGSKKDVEKRLKIF